jgi:hypothetical protein
MSLEEQIKQTEEELEAYKAANFANPQIIHWLDEVLGSLYRLQFIDNTESLNTI